jgi:hypothetical protein
MPQIQQVNVDVVTNDDNKEDSRFELDIVAGNTAIYHLAAGEGENWDNGDEHNFQEQLSADVGENTPIRVIAALQDGNWGQSNHWDCHITVVLDTDDGRKLMWGRTCAFKTGSSRRRHSINFGAKSLRIHGQH